MEESRLQHDTLDVGWVTALLKKLGCNRPEDLDEGSPQRRQARQRGLQQELLHLAIRACRWAATVDDLCRFIIRVAKEYGPRKLPAYLRKCLQQEDPGCLLRSHKNNLVGRASETWWDYSATTERALQGPHAADCEKLAAGAALLLAEEDGERRVQLRLELRRMLMLGNQAAARRVLLEIVPKPSATDSELARALDGAIAPFWRQRDEDPRPFPELSHRLE